MAAVYLRRRVAVAALAMGIVLAGSGLVRGSTPPVASTPDAPRSVQVTAGLTLWEVARDHAAPGTDLRAYVAEILRLNDLDAPPGPGTRIKLPRSS
jgi:LysM repeat protein